MIDDLQALSVFEAVVRLGSMSAAARELGTTPSAVSQRLRTLESAYGVTLLLRSTRKLRLTDVGERVAAHARTLVHAAGEARAQMRLARDALEGELRLAAPVGFARHVAPALSGLLALHRGLRLRLHVDDRHIDLIEARIDIALRAGRLPDSDWVARRLADFRFVLCAAPAYLARAGTPAHPDDLAAHDWIAPEAAAGGYPLELRGPQGDSMQVRVTPRLVSNNQLSIGQLCASGMGLALLVQPDAEPDLTAGHLVPVLPGWAPPSMPVWALTARRGTQPAKVRAAISALQAAFRRQPGAEP